MPDIFVEENYYQETSEACIIDLTPPTFAGINFLDVESRGQIRAGWSAATDPNTPIRYEVYIKANNDINLFNTTNITGITDKLQLDIFTMPDGSFLQNGTTYYVGVRAVDALSNRDSNTVNLNVISTGVLTSIDTYQTFASWSVNEDNDFILTAWANKNESLANTPSAILGTASYQVYNKAGSAIVGMSGTGVSANSQGLYVFTAVNNLLDFSRNHYEIKVSISVDGEVRDNFIPVLETEKRYFITGVADLNISGQVIGSFWLTRNDQIAIADIGPANISLFSADGINLSVTQTGITPNAEGLYVITPITLPFPLDVTEGFIVKVELFADGVTYTQNIILGNEPTVYDIKAVFSINSLNQLEASFWSTRNNNLISGATLGTASYQIFDKNGVAVVGLTQTGITADGNGYFHITPVAATLLTDLTHYTAKITINIAGQNRVSTKGFTLLGT